MSNLACAITNNGTTTCVVCPAVPFIAAVPGQTLVDNNLGWNAGAYSQTRLEGDCYTQFSVPAATGVVCGLAPTRLSNAPTDVPYGFYCYKSAGAEYWVVSEAGIAMTAPVLRVPATDTFRIERRGTTVRYFFNGKTVYSSLTPSNGSLVVVSCLYAANDGVN